MKNFLNSLREIRKYPSAIVGSVIILALVIAAVMVLITMPYKETIDFWRGGEASWYANPRYAPPKWFNWFRKDKMVESFYFISNWMNERKHRDDISIYTQYCRMNEDGIRAPLRHYLKNNIDTHTLAWLMSKKYLVYKIMKKY